MSEVSNGEGMPIAITLAPGIYYRCSCGKSQHQPFCDESHRGLGSHPIRFEIHEQKKVYLCTCKKTKTAPFCDSSCGVRLP